MNEVRMDTLLSVEEELNIYRSRTRFISILGLIVVLLVLYVINGSSYDGEAKLKLGTLAISLELLLVVMLKFFEPTTEID